MNLEFIMVVPGALRNRLNNYQTSCTDVLSTADFIPCVSPSHWKLMNSNSGQVDGTKCESGMFPSTGLEPPGLRDVSLHPEPLRLQGNGYLLAPSNMLSLLGSQTNSFFGKKRGGGAMKGIYMQQP